jgi:7-cyano-7-deazaguanine synthase
MHSRAVVCLSGGQDSSTVLAIAKLVEDQVSAISVDYGQKHGKELDFARIQAERWGVDHTLVGIDAPGLFESALTTRGVEIPNEEWSVDKQGPPPTVVHGRNQLLLSLAASVAASRGASRIYVGCSQIDYSGYPDCREEFLQALEVSTCMGLGKPIRIVAPLLHRSKVWMVRTGTALGVDWASTWTCYKGGDLACGVCPACRLRLDAFQKAGIKDPLFYETEKE